MVERWNYLHRKLSEAGATVTLRGTGAATFIYAECNGRAIEASLINNDWWIEFWEVDADEDAEPVDEHLAATDKDAFLLSVAWLTDQSVS